MKYLFIFMIMSLIGFILELIYRSFVSRKFIKPGFMQGPSLPVYGFGGLILSLISNIKILPNYYLNILILSFIAGILLTGIEYLGGIIMLKLFKIKLWDYSQTKLNINGLICLKMFFIWIIASFIYLALINNLLNDLYNSLKNIDFLLGFYYGIFIIDLYFSFKLLNKIKSYNAIDKNIINYELLKIQVRNENINNKALQKIFYLLYPYQSINEFIKNKA